MDGLLNQLGREAISFALLQEAIGQFHVFTLVLLRISGLMTVGPVFSQPAVPWNVRVLLVVAVSLLVTPATAPLARQGFQQLDADHDGRLTIDELPAALRGRFADRMQSAPDGTSFVSQADFATLSAAVPTLGVDYVAVLAREFALGFALGLGVMIILSALELAGQLIDQQTGTALGEIFNPGLGSTSSPSGQLLFLLGTAVLLVMPPWDGHLRLFASLLDTFRVLPPGAAVLTDDGLALLQALFGQSLVLALKVAAPTLAAMSLVALTMGFLGHTVPQINILVVGFPVRIVLGLGILLLTLSGFGTVVAEALDQALNKLASTIALSP